MSLLAAIRHKLRRVSLVPKMLLLTVGVGVMLTAIVDSVQTARLDRIFGAELKQKLASRAQEDRVNFDNRVAAYHGDIKLILSQKRFVDYVTSKRFSEKSSGVMRHSTPPPWLPDTSIMRHLSTIQFALLLDGRGRVREVYSGVPDAFPRSLLQPDNLLVQLSHYQSYMTSVDGRPFLLTAESYRGPDEAATLLLAQELNDDFLIALYGLVNRENIVALMSAGPERVIASSRPELIRDGAAFAALTDDYLVAGKSFFDWGASDLLLQFTTFISKAEFSRLNESVLKAQRQERIVIAAVLILSFSLLMLWMTRQIQKLTRSVGEYAHQRLGLPLPATTKGDQIAVLEDQFHIFTHELETSREQLKRQAEDLLREKTVYLDNILQSSPVSIIAADLELRIKYYNAAAENVFGYESRFAVGKKAGELAAEGSAIQTLFNNAFAIINQGGSYDDVAVIQGTGPTKYFDVAVYGITDKKDLLIGYLLIAHDITERLRTQKDLLLFRSMVDQSNDAFFVADAQTGSILDVNDKACSSLGYTRNELLALKITDISLLTTDSPSWEERVGMIRRRSSFIFESSHRRKDGSLFPVEISTRLISQEGKDYLIGVARDITQRKKIEMELRIKDSAIAASINGIAISDMQGVLHYVNRAYIAMMGYADESEMLGRPLADFAESVERAEMVKEALRSRGGWVGELTGRKKDGSLVPRLMSASLVIDDAGRPVSVLGSFVDITERKKAEAARLEYEQRFRAIFDAAKDGIIVVEQGRLIMVNKAFCTMLGYTREEAVQRGISDIHPAKDLPRILSDFESHSRGEKNVSTDIPVKRKDESVFYADISSALFTVGAQAYVVGIFRDITERRQFIGQLEESERKFRAVFDSAQDGIMVANAETLRFLMVNAKAGELLGYTPAELGMLGVPNIHPHDALPLVGKKFQGILEKKTVMTEDVPMLRKDGSIFHADINASPVELQGSLYAIGIFRDITERKRAEAALRSSRETLQKIIDGSSAVIFAKDLDGKYLFINSLFERLFHVSKSEIIGKTDSDIFPAEVAAAFREADRKALQAGTTIEAEEQVPQDDGLHYYISLKFPLYDDSGKPFAVCGLATDITERKKGEVRIAGSLQEKEVLLREIHHRVKNNLQIISSLLYFQAKKVRDEAGLAALREGQERLKSMILVHEKLYQSKDLARIDFSDYVRTLTDQMLQSYAAVRSKIKVTVEAEALLLPIELALPCGMIINELLTNVFKYAFPDEMTGTALVRVISEQDHMTITVGDSGVGLPAGMDAERPDTFGLQLVRNLANQMRGAVSFGRNGGTTVTIDIPLDSAADRSGA